MSAAILCVDDERAVRQTLQLHLARRGDRITLANDATQALAHLHEAPFDLVITDVAMPGASGLELLRKVRETWPETPVIVLTGNASVDDAVQAMKAGAADYLKKPVGREELYLVVDKALANRSLAAELVRLRREVRARFGFEALVGASPVMRRLYEDLEAVADSQATVLVIGPTGSGKELIAHALHHRSRRGPRAFVRVNCAAIPAPLVESELFGHERGAFTGAVRQHLGKFEQADGGTIFLDEIGELEPAVQAKLLRVLESGEIQRVGGTETLRVDVRVVAATHRDLQADAEAGRFRRDLYYRLAVVVLRVPPLRERRDDIPLLADHFLRRLRAREGRDVPDPSPETLRRLVAHDWPGNVRELEHALERAVLLHRHGPALEVDVGLPSPTPPSPPPGEAPRAAQPPASDAPDLPLAARLDAVERAAILRALAASGGVQAQAADRLGISKSNLTYRLRRLGIVRRGATFAGPDEA